MTVHTIGHSTRSIESFIDALKSRGVTTVVDVRAVPRSRHNPQFNQETLPDSLAAAGVRYEHVAALGGLRKPVANSPNVGWRNTGFRGFADYMVTQEFESGIARLANMSGSEHVAVMCAEAVPWRCHRSLIADALLVRGVTVEHILAPGRSQPHALTPWARVEGTSITYPAEAEAD